MQTPLDHLGYTLALLDREQRKVRVLARIYTHDRRNGWDADYYRQFYTRRRRALLAMRWLRQVARKFDLANEVDDLPLFARRRSS